MRRKKKQGRSRKGSGSVYQIHETLWCGQCTVGHRVDTGKPIRRKVYGTTREEAEEKLRAEIHKYRSTHGDDPEAEERRKRMPLKHDLEHWLAGEIKPRVDKGTYQLYAQRVKDYILPHLGDLPSPGLNEYLIREWYEKLEQEGCSADLRKKVGMLLRRFLDRLREFGWIKSNPARRLPLPKATAQEMRPLDEEEAKRFLCMVRKHRLYPLWLLALDTGMRQGEILALEWTDLDLISGVISVTKSVRTGEKGGARVKEVKSKASRRRIRVCGHTLETLRQWREESKGKLVFPARRSRRTGLRERHMKKGNLTTTFQSLLSKAGLPKIRFHDIRHTHATLALLKTKNIKAISARLGHADINITLNTYAHYLPIMEEEIVTAMETLVSPQNESNKEVTAKSDKPQISPTGEEAA